MACTCRVLLGGGYTLCFKLKYSASTPQYYVHYPTDMFLETYYLHHNNMIISLNRFRDTAIPNLFLPETSNARPSLEEWTPSYKERNQLRRSPQRWLSDEMPYTVCKT